MEEATVTETGAPAQPQLPAELQMTETDLTLMIGEGEIAMRQKDKINRYVNTQNQILLQRAIKAESELAALKADSTAFSTTSAEQIAAHILSERSLRDRITQLEGQVNEVALERDEIKKQYKELQEAPRCESARQEPVRPKFPRRSK